MQAFIVLEVVILTSWPLQAGDPGEFSDGQVETSGTQVIRKKLD